MKAKQKRFLHPVALCLALALVLSIFPLSVLAADEQEDDLNLTEQAENVSEELSQEEGEPFEGQYVEDTEKTSTLELSPPAESMGFVRVTIENSTYPLGAWTGILVDEWMEITGGSSMMSVIKDAIECGGFSQNGCESGYIDEINGLCAFDGGEMSGWMGTLNDWFTNEGFDCFTVANGRLCDGDEIRVMYTADYGADLGGDWEAEGKELSSLTVSAGAISPGFSPETKNYTLTLDDNIGAVNVKGFAANKNYQVRCYSGTAEYRHSAYIPVENGTVITVRCGDPAWPSMSDNSAPAEEYVLTVVKSAAKKSTDVENAYSATKSHLESSLAQNGLTVGSTGGDWIAIGLSRAGTDMSAWKESYYSSAVSYVASSINAKEQLHKNKSSDNSRLIIALTALGYDVTDVGGHNLLMGLTSLSYVKRQGTNGPIWALIAFDCHDYAIPDGGYGDDQVSREKLIAFLLSKQLPDGGWNLSGTASDPDMTGMAVQALAKYYNSNAEVKAALDRAVNCMAGMIGDDGSVSSWGTVNSESCAQVITALTALGIDPASDSRFRKNGGSPIDNLAGYFVEGCGFAHVLDDAAGYVGGEYNQMATEQAFYALVSWYRLKEGKTSLYDMTDVTLPSAGVTVLHGDVNGDALVNSTDAAMIYACHNEKLSLSETQRHAADVNGDRSVNSTDAAMVYAYHNGKISSFPADSD